MAVATPRARSRRSARGALLALPVCLAASTSLGAASVLPPSGRLLSLPDGHDIGLDAGVAAGEDLRLAGVALEITPAGLGGWTFGLGGATLEGERDDIAAFRSVDVDGGRLAVTLLRPLPGRVGPLRLGLRADYVADEFETDAPLAVGGLATDVAIEHRGYRLSLLADTPAPLVGGAHAVGAVGVVYRDDTLRFTVDDRAEPALDGDRTRTVGSASAGLLWPFGGFRAYAVVGVEDGWAATLGLRYTSVPR